MSRNWQQVIERNTRDIPGPFPPHELSSPEKLLPSTSETWQVPHQHQLNQILWMLILSVKT